MILKCDLHFKISPYILLPLSLIVFFLFVRKNDFQPLFYQIPKSTFHVKMPAFVLSKPKIFHKRDLSLVFCHMTYSPS